MIIQHGKGSTEYGRGIRIDLSGEEVAIAIDAYLTSHGLNINGPRTVKVNGELCRDGYVYVDPSGSLNVSGR